MFYYLSKKDINCTPNIYQHLMYSMIRKDYIYNQGIFIWESYSLFIF
jgi:hypothetical protein